MNRTIGANVERRWWRRGLVIVLLLSSIGAAFVAGVLVHKYRFRIRQRLSAMQSGGVIAASFYNIAVKKVNIPAAGRDGAIASLGDGILLATRLGELWFIDSAHGRHAVPLAIPVNVDDFLNYPKNADVGMRDNFGVKDILLQIEKDSVRLLATHNVWFADQDCYGLRVSSLVTTSDVLKGEVASSAASWRTVFDTKPCQRVHRPGGTFPHATNAAGGRLETLPDGQILLTVGNWLPEIPRPDEYWSPENSFGKTWVLDLATGSARPYTIGHRNPQGLVVGPNGQVWLTEHGPQGGDELNLLVEGRNYGFPEVSYGTEYGQMVWPPNVAQGRHEGFEKPLFAFLPSVGISQLIVLRGDEFPIWRGDLVIGSLKEETLFRVRIEEERVKYVEPLLLNHRVRDLVETSDGSIVVKTDDDVLLYLTRVETGSKGVDALNPVERGKLLAATCMGCHSFAPEGSNGLGPNLFRVVGRDVGSVAGFSYSAALRSVPGKWDEKRLAQFISNPANFAPGTLMAGLPPYNKQQLADLIAYLSSLH